MSSKNKSNSIQNRRARFDYELLDKYTAGIQLLGHEVKSVRLGNADLRGAYVNVRENEAWLIGAYIAPYKNASLDESYDPLRTRKLLLNKSELKKLVAAKQQKLTIVATKILNKNRFIKLELHTARGKKLHDKRETIKKRQFEREKRNN